MRREARIVFRPHMRGCRRHVGAWAGVVVHWTGGESADHAIHTIWDRGLSIHYVVDPDGLAIQTAEHTTRCSHVGRPGNDRFLGVEVVCRGFASREDLALAAALDPTLRTRDELDWDAPRDVYSDTIGGRVVRMASFNPSQIVTVVELLEELAAQERFPRLVPACSAESWLGVVRPLQEPERYVVEHEGVRYAPSVWRDSREDGLASTWRGALGHYHVHPHKCDPGTAIMYRLWAEGWNPSGQPLRL